MAFLKKFVVGIIVVGALVVIGGAALNQALKKSPEQKPVQQKTSQTTSVVVDPGWPISAHPSSQAASWRFEEETVIARATTQSNHDLLRAKLLSGQSGDIPIQYEGGTRDDRLARIVPDPTDPENSVLHFWLKNARIEGARPGYHKGRIQLHLTGINKPESYARFRMYLSPDLAAYRTYPKEHHWFTLSELWSRPTEGNHFRITLGIGKEAGAGKPLYFVVTGDKQAGGVQGAEVWKTVWGSTNTTQEVPIGEWVDVEIGYRQGDQDTGKFFMTMKRSSDAAPITIFNLTQWTYNPNAKKPSPLTDWDIFKLYTSGEVIDHIRNQGGITQVYWDDLKLYDAWQDDAK